MKEQKFILPDPLKIDELTELAELTKRREANNEDIEHELGEFHNKLKKDWSATDKEVEEFKLVLAQGFDYFLEYLGPFINGRVAKTDFYQEIEGDINKLTQKLGKRPYNYKSNELDKLLKYILIFCFRLESSDVDIQTYWSSKIIDFLGYELKLDPNTCAAAFPNLLEMVGGLIRKIEHDPVGLYYMAKLDYEFQILSTENVTKH